jgi:hypothetical protein
LDAQRITEKGGAGCQLVWSRRPIPLVRSKSCDYQERARNRYEILQHGYHKIWNLERAHQTGAHLIPHKSSYYAANRA